MNAISVHVLTALFIGRGCWRRARAEVGGIHHPITVGVALVSGTTELVHGNSDGRLWA